MASLRDTVKDYQDELRDGIAWVAFWKQGRSWNAEYFHLDMDDTLYPEDRSRLEEIKSIDPAAVILNGYYCGHLGEDMSLDELTAGVRYHYENSIHPVTFYCSPFFLDMSTQFNQLAKIIHMYMLTISRFFCIVLLKGGNVYVT